MSSLATYLQSQYVADKRQLDRIEDVIESVIPIFHDPFMFDDGSTRTWPYVVEHSGTPPDQHFSFSTHSMILFVLTSILHSVRPRAFSKNALPVLFPEKIRTPLKAKQLKGISSAVPRAMNDLLKKVTWKDDIIVTSTTYGSNDPMTLSWLSELTLRPPTGSEIADDQLKKLRAVAQGVCERGPGVLLDPLAKQPGSSENPHPFLWLRTRHLAKAAARLEWGSNKSGPQPAPLETPKISLKAFEDELQRQLGSFTVADSRFDPAILVFALEGALQFDPQAVSDGTIESFFQILEAAQKGNSYWRPVTPFLDNRVGMVLFPVSVEISNSLLRIYEILDSAKRNTHFSRLEALLRRYVEWLLARAERIPNRPESKQSDELPELVGWHSEHVNKRGMVHLWETSQVLLFLVHYWSLLQRKVAKEGLDAAGLRLKAPADIVEAKGYWDDEPLVALSQKNAPVPDGNVRGEYAILGKIYDNFVTASKPRSLLLYGPPGTGKTTVAEQMAFSLKWPLLTITVSDFLATGAAEVEARAKAVFQVLEEQERMVILFDEIDQFLLDRNSDLYKEQEGIFQFLTPGMLTKFQNLRDANRSIFIVATNYEERIDGAIKRQGRIDDQFILSLPDKQRRRAFLWRFICDSIEDLGEKSVKEFVEAVKGDAAKQEVVDALQMKPVQLREDRGVRQQFENAIDLGDLLKETVWFGYGDLKHLVKNRLKIKPGDSWATIVAKLREERKGVQPSVKLGGYSRRFTVKEYEQVPAEEFAILLYLVGECDGRMNNYDAAAVNAVFASLPEDKILERLTVSDDVRTAMATAVKVATKNLPQSES